MFGAEDMGLDPAAIIEHMSEATAGDGWVWEIQVKDSAKLGTHPAPFYAPSDEERDWYLARHLHGRPAEDYTVRLVPDPLTQEMRATIRDRQMRATEGAPQNGRNPRG